MILGRTESVNGLKIQRQKKVYTGNNQSRTSIVHTALHKIFFPPGFMQFTLSCLVGTICFESEIILYSKTGVEVNDFNGFIDNKLLNVEKFVPKISFYLDEFHQLTSTLQL